MSLTAQENWQLLAGTNFFRRFVVEGKLVQTERIDPVLERIQHKEIEGWPTILRHELIPFISYPYEWSFGMLKDAALLQLELLAESLKEGMILKDSSSFNIQWTGATPVFIDIPSFEKLVPGEPWVGYFQFCQLFLYPLFLQAYKDLDFHPWLRGRIDGIDPDQMNQVMSIRDLVRTGVFTDVYLLAKMQGRFGDTSTNLRDSMRESGFRKEMIEANVRRLRKVVQGLEWGKKRSTWSDYVDDHNYTDSDMGLKNRVVKEIAESKRWRLVWDIGCNTGTFSDILAQSAECVISMDSDHLAVERYYRALKERGCRNILPLVVNISDPSPGLGWRGEERKTLPQRGKPDLLLCLALIHHIVIGANIPLREFIRWLADSTGATLIEFVTKDDPMVKKLLKNRVDQYGDYEVGTFEKILGEFFRIAKRIPLESGTRVIYSAEGKQ
ncbi:class I SAM-dependent methyltransferase [bacterium]|nr:class I SAM-dependent methyltransferase [bacterium]